jgi:biopolymer transport protein ExbD
MTPMIDVVFQLLIFFMVGMKMKVPDGILEAHLPKDRGPGVRQQDEDPLKLPEFRIRILRNEVENRVDILFEGRRCESIEDLGEKLKLLGAGGGLESVPIVIDGSPKIEFRYIIGVLNACIAAKFKNVSFKAPPPMPAASGEAAPAASGG